MKRIYANLLGTWTDITDVGTVADYQSPGLYFEENLTYEKENTVPKAFEFGYVNVQYKGKNYRVDPSCIQIVTQSE